ncbi:MAG: alpha/beta fold hydrolase [Candidatus Nitrosopolaris sp.]
MIHSFPDFSYTWRNQMVALAPIFQVVALDLRGYNLSDKPLGGEHYSMDHLVGDVQAVISHIGRNKAIIVGNGWWGHLVDVCHKFTDLNRTSYHPQLSPSPWAGP